MARSKYFYTNFKDGVGPITQDDGTVSSGTAADVNLFTAGGIPWYYAVIGTQTVLAPALHDKGLDLTLTDTNGQGGSFVPYGINLGQPLQFTIGGPAFFCEWVVQVTDWSGCELLVGFQGGAAATGYAFNATRGSITYMALIGNNAGGGLNIFTTTNKNTGTATDTDTTIDLIDGDVMKAKVLVSATGVVTYTLSKAATATDTTFVAQTLTTAAFTFDDTDVVVPTLYTKSHTDDATLKVIKSFECGYQNA